MALLALGVFPAKSELDGTALLRFANLWLGN
jgi:hypothetical protein